MMDQCGHCDRALLQNDMVKDVCRLIALEQQEQDIRGLAFRCYVCGNCGQECLIVEIERLANESDGEFIARKVELRGHIQRMSSRMVSVTLVEGSSESSFHV